MIDNLKEKFETELESLFKNQVNLSVNSFKEAMGDKYDINLVVSYFIFLFDYYFWSSSFFALSGEPLGSSYLPLMLNRYYLGKDAPVDNASNRLEFSYFLLKLEKVVPSFDDLAQTFCSFLFERKTKEIDFNMTFMEARDSAKRAKEAVFEFTKKFEENKRIYNLICLDPSSGFLLERTYYSLEGIIEDAKGEEVDDEDRRLIINYLENAIEASIFISEDKKIHSGIAKDLYDSVDDIEEKAEQRMNETNNSLTETKTNLYDWIKFFLIFMSIKDIDILSDKEKAQKEREVMKSVFKDNKEVQALLSSIEGMDDVETVFADTAFIYYSLFWNEYSELLDKDPRICALTSLLVMSNEEAAKHSTVNDSQISNVFACCVLGVCSDFSLHKVTDMLDFIPKERRETHDCYIYRTAAAARLLHFYFETGKMQIEETHSFGKMMYNEIQSLTIGEKTLAAQEEINENFLSDRERTKQYLKPFIDAAHEILDEIKSVFNSD